MAAVTENKYYLRSVHQEIGLFDRKLAHLLKYEKFATDTERDAAARKLTLKRELLVKTAKRLVAEGTEFDAKDLPRSLYPELAEDAEEAAPLEAVAKESPAAAEKSKPASSRPASPFAGTSLDWQQSVREYMDKKAKA